MKFVRGFFATVVWLVALTNAPSAFSSEVSNYEQGIQAIENYRYSDALMHFQKAAEHGDRRASRNLGLMLLYGDRLYGKEVTRSQEQAKRWLRVAENQGCEVSKFMLRVLAQHGG